MLSRRVPTRRIARAPAHLEAVCAGCTDGSSATSVDSDRTERRTRATIVKEDRTVLPVALGKNAGIWYGHLDEAPVQSTDACARTAGRASRRMLICHRTTEPLRIRSSLYGSSPLDRVVELIRDLPWVGDLAAAVRDPGCTRRPSTAPLSRANRLVIRKPTRRVAVTTPSENSLKIGPFSVGRGLADFASFVAREGSESKSSLARLMPVVSLSGRRLIQSRAAIRAWQLRNALASPPPSPSPAAAHRRSGSPSASPAGPRS